MHINGHVEPGFEPVADAFRLNFSDRGDYGAGCAVVIDSTPVVNIWGGLAREDMPWTEHTVTPVFSVSKAVTTCAVLMAVDRGLIDFDTPVSHYWPEFGVNGKDEVTVRDTLAHRAGVPSFSHPWSPEELEEWFPIIEDLAAQEPLWKPGTSFAYHAVSFGFLAGEILRRATGLRPSGWLAGVAEQLSIRMTYGTDVGNPDLARVQYPRQLANPQSSDAAEDALLRRISLEDGAYGPDQIAAVNSTAFLASESPGANLVTNATGLATFFGSAVAEKNSVRLLSDEIISTATVPRSYGRPFLGDDVGAVWGAGFMLHSPKRAMVGPRSFGHDGAGGQLAFAHPGYKLGFGYVTNQHGGEMDVRADALTVALRECL